MIRRSLYFGFLFTCMISLSHITVTRAQPEVVVEQGRLRGKTVRFTETQYINIDKNLDVYEGVPFAEPPVRFEYPVKKTAWSGTYDASYARPMCYQDSSYSRSGLPVSEDCLYMNIYVPQGISNAAVMVWIHGGGWSEGAGSIPEFNGEPLSAVGDVILVTLNYRLTTFGYLTTGDSNLPGNYGMLDQVEALKWIQANIHAFGGDKDEVTIFGESAGAGNVNYHLLSKLTTGLFKQAVMQSGTAIPSGFLQEVDAGREAAFNIGIQLGCSITDSAQLRQCLSTVTAEALYNAAQAAKFNAAPSIDGYFLDDHPLNLLQRQDFQRVPLLLGTNEDEGTFNVLSFHPENIASPMAPFIPKIEFDTLLSAVFSGSTIVQDSVKQQYLDWTIQDQNRLDYFWPMVRWLTDYFFTRGADMLARIYATAGQQVYRYEMTHDPTVSFYSLPGAPNPDWIGASHQEDLPFVFGNPFMRVQTRREMTGPEKEFSVKMMRFWTTFAKTGTPSMSTNPESELYWPTFTVPDLNYKVLDLTPSTGKALRADNMHFWNDLVPKLLTFTSELPEVEREWRNEFSNWKYGAMEDWWDAFNAYKASTSGAN